MGFDVLMRVMQATGRQASMLAFAAGTVHASSPWIGWLVYPVYGVILGLAWSWITDRPSWPRRQRVADHAGRRAA